MSLIRINENFSATPGSKTELTNAKSCICKSGILYVNGAGATGVAEGAKSKAVVLIDGGIAIQKHASAVIMSVADKGVLELMPKPAAKAVNNGASRSSGSNDASELQRIMTAADLPKF